MEPNNPAGKPESDSRQIHDAETILSNLQFTADESTNLHLFCQTYARQDVQPWVTLYEISREFGGHEEGGWYYDWLTPVACQFCPTALQDTQARLGWELQFRESHGAKFEGEPDLLSTRETLISDTSIPAYWSASPRRATHIIRFEPVPFASASHTRPHYE